MEQYNLGVTSVTLNTTKSPLDGKRAEDKETEEPSVGRLTQVKLNLVREDGIDSLLKPDNLIFCFKLHRTHRQNNK